MLRDLGVPLVVTRQVSAWFREEVDPARFHPSRFPCWGLARDAHSFYYGFPILGDPPALKVSIHAPRAPTDPDHVDRTVQDEEIEELRDGLSKVMPEMREAPLAHASVCLYTNSPDGDFIIDLLENDPPLAVACGFSGHGFKFAPVVGEVLADLALDGGTCLPIGFLSRRRFGAAAG
jgi:sarcosine oxidase